MSALDLTQGIRDAASVADDVLITRAARGDADAIRPLGGNRALAAILGGIPLKRTADKCARLYRVSTRGSTAHRAGDLRNSCSTAELCRRR